MEVYLNSIEMGEGIYGAQAVAQAHFQKEAYALTRAEAALIAATLPNPRRFNSANPSAYMRKRQAQILSLMDKLLQLPFGYGTDDYQSPKKGTDKKRKKWRADLNM